jgi:hypothetical protein
MLKELASKLLAIAMMDIVIPIARISSNSEKPA